MKKINLGRRVRSIGLSRPRIEGGLPIVTIAEVVGEPIPSRYRVPARWRIEVRSDTGTDFGFKCAIAIDGTLQLIEVFTPYDFDFSAAKFRALFEAKTDAALNVSAYSDVEGEFRKMTAFSGSRSGQVIFDPHGSEGHVLWGQEVYRFL